MPIYTPDSKVSSPDTEPTPMRGRTIQNWVSALSKLAASFDKLALTTTVWLSALSTTSDTCPTVTSRYLTGVLPTCTPSPFKKLIVTRGPAFTQLLTSSEIPIATATIGTTHTNRGIQRRF